MEPYRKNTLEKLIDWYVRWCFNLNKDLSSFFVPNSCFAISKIFFQNQINSFIAMPFFLESGYFFGQQYPLIIGTLARGKKNVNKVQK